ncbi:pseudaminic acid cytidylyltransferase [Polynucleobacter sp. UB-Tiil-W10]|uniref:pseudaminic acid cytidylyltransferase n=1 Tax=Polynucleobacter sp. UB-Tiil-W10 TaxID=1855648 RepID=UPI001C0DAE75|nr:pseudaminic acid cytidylyltransferase [Polynucleobacter sp. UB-Tiil-W10]MBU3540796.1 pseudaminic acid cytidylyltransferase [Polynucleobacter sp. UB-Tiil-W10]
MRVAIIPARGGSKRIPYKNIKLFHGKPMIAWSIMAAQHSKIFDRVIVSTDDSEIAEIAITCGAEAPFIRPAKLADDHATTADVMEHAVKLLVHEGHSPSELCCIYATAPFIEVNDLVSGLELLISGGWQYVFPAAEFTAPIFRGFKVGCGGLEMIFPEHYLTRSQDLPRVFHDAGQFYWGTKNAWLSKAPIFSNKSQFIELPRLRVQDIDTPEDWEIAEKIFTLLSSAK